ncbi:Mediator of RNA polymerase II transcription subunit 16 [Linum grandiflorum]
MSNQPHPQQEEEEEDDVEVDVEEEDAEEEEEAGGISKEPDEDGVAQALEVAAKAAAAAAAVVVTAVVGSEKVEAVVSGEEEESVEKVDDPMEEDSLGPATVFSIKLKQPRSNLMHKMSVPELCRNFSAVAWCGKLNAIACASETCARIPSSNANPPFWIPIHIVIPERPTECAVFNVIADSPRDSVQFIEWSPTSCPRALLIANFHGRITIWTQPSHGPANLVRDASCWQREHEWRQDIAVVTKWLSGVSPYRWLSSKSSGSSNPKSTFEEKFLSQQSQNSARWPNFLCVCSVFSSGSVQLHWSQWPSSQSNASPKWFCTSKGLLGAGPSGIMAADAIITDSGAMHVAGVPIVNPSTVVVWEVTPGPGTGLQATPKTSSSCGVPPSLNPPNWAGFAPLAAYLFSWQEYLISEVKQGKKHTDKDLCDAVTLHCSPVSNFSAYVSPEAAAQSATTTTWGSGVTAVAFDPTRGGSVIAVVIVEGWRVQRWESSLQPVVLHQIFGSPTSSFGGQAPMQTVWVSKVDTSIPPTNDFKNHQEAVSGPNSDVKKTTDACVENAKKVIFDPFDLPSDVRTLARIVYSAHGGEIAIAFLRGGVHIFSGPNFAPVDNYQINVGSAIASPAFSSTSCCSASVWHDISKECTILKIIRVLPPAVPSSQIKANSATWERAIAERFWWSLLVGVDWWDAVGCTQSAAEDGIVSLNSVIAVLDADFHSLPSVQHRQQYGPSLDRIKCRLLEGTNAQEVRAMVLDMQARLLLDMLGKGIESALINPSALVAEPWQASGETLSGIDPEAMAAYVDAILDLSSHFITRLRRYASFCRTLASHAVTAGTGNNRNMVTSPTQSAASQATTPGGQNGATNATGSTQVQAWVQGAIAKISSTSDGVPSSAPNPISGPPPFMPISINTGTFPGTPAVRLIGDCHFVHRLCQLLLFCFFFRRTQLTRSGGVSQRNNDSNMQKPQPGLPGKVEEANNAASNVKPSTAMVRSEDGSAGARSGQIVPATKGAEDGPAGRSRLGCGNAGQGYTFEEVKVLFLILMDLCRRTAALAHPLPVSQVGSNNIQVRLHYIDGNYTVLPEVVEASLGPHMQNMPRPRGADAAGLLLRELELHPPSEEWHRRNMFGGPWSDPEDVNSPEETPESSDLLDFSSLENCDVHYGPHGIWPKRRRLSERDAAFGLNTSVGLGAYLGIMGSRRDVVTALWKTVYKMFTADFSLCFTDRLKLRIQRANSELHFSSLISTVPIKPEYCRRRASGEQHIMSTVTHSLAFRVMRLCRPSLHVDTQLRIDPADLLVGEDIFDDPIAAAQLPSLLDGLSPKSKDSAELSYGNRFLLSHPFDSFGHTGLLVLPQAFGAIYLGETFCSYISINNSSNFEVRDVIIKAEIQTEKQRILLLDTSKSPVETIRASGRYDFIVEHDVKELGAHTLVCTALYSDGDGERKYLPQFFKFIVANPLSVRTKVRIVKENTYLEACIENHTKANLYMDQVEFEPAQPWTAQVLKADDHPTDNDTVSRTIFKPPVLVRSGGGIHNYLYHLKTASQDPVRNNVLGKLQITWRTNLGEPGRLQTQQILGTPVTPKEIELRILEIPSVLNLNRPFSVHLNLANQTDRALGPFEVWLSQSSPLGEKAVMINGLQTMELPKLEASATTDFHLVRIITHILLSLVRSTSNIQQKNSHLKATSVLLVQNLIATKLGVQRITGITVLNTADKTVYDPLPDFEANFRRRGLIPSFTRVWYSHRSVFSALYKSF